LDLSHRIVGTQQVLLIRRPEQRKILRLVKLLGCVELELCDDSHGLVVRLGLQWLILADPKVDVMSPSHVFAHPHLVLALSQHLYLLCIHRFAQRLIV
jgi:hypothetical protein